MAQGAGGVLLGLQGFRQDAPHLDEFVDDPAVDFKVGADTGRTQPVRIEDALIDQGIAFGEPDPGRGDAVYVRGVQRRETPVIAVGRRIDVVVEEIGDVAFLEHKAVGKGLVGGS